MAEYVWRLLLLGQQLHDASAPRDAQRCATLRATTRRVPGGIDAANSPMPR
ncbi:MAG: hypothetical protein HY332_10915 [Chloroflexi bacterium]|nr:hypothetical protein [Chloroflexota bacterium]